MGDPWIVLLEYSGWGRFPRGAGCHACGGSGHPASRVGTGGGAERVPPGSARLASGHACLSCHGSASELFPWGCRTPGVEAEAAGGRWDCGDPSCRAHPSTGGWRGKGSGKAVTVLPAPAAHPRCKRRCPHSPRVPLWVF